MRRKDPRTEPRAYLHDVRVWVDGSAAIVSVTCEGAACEICAKDPAAAKRAENPYWPHELGEAPP